jgi:F0F1-type ATP synthase epsilon subunit
MIQLDVTVLTPKEVLFEGKASSVILPGEQGVFEVLPFHKRLMSRLITGFIFVDEKSLAISRGIVKINQNKVLVVVEV